LISAWVLSLAVLLFSSAGAAQSWKAEWDKTVAAATKEGKLVLWGPPGSDVRSAYADGFQKAFPGIQVEYMGATGSKQGPRMLAERRAGIYSVDILTQGTTTMLQTLMPQNALEPIPPALIHPEVTTVKNWLDQKLEFSDNAGRYNLVFASYVKTPIAVNPKLVDLKEIRSYWDLVNPKWAGKIAMKDPAAPGPGLATATFWYAEPGLGPDFMRKLFSNQKIVRSNDDRQLLEWLVQGRYGIVISPSEFTATSLKAKGLPVELVGAEQFKEGSYLTAGNGSVALINRAPHPNAAKLFLNWLLGKEGQSRMTHALGYASRRLDVSHEHLEPAIVPREGVRYQPNYKEQYVNLRGQILALLQEVYPN
jgi:iron(III) transport system substrate-binding protein